MNAATTAEFDVAEVQAVARRIAERDPDKTNPTDPDGRSACLYTSSTDPDHHCYAGQIMLELGCALPPREGMFPSGSSDRHRFTHDAMRLLIVLQNEADADERDDLGVSLRRAKPWGKAYADACAFEGIEP